MRENADQNNSKYGYFSRSVEIFRIKPLMHNFQKWLDIL